MRLSEYSNFHQSKEPEPAGRKEGSERERERESLYRYIDGCVDVWVSQGFE